MTRPNEKVKPEPTRAEANASRILDKIFQFHPTATDYKIAVEILASELIAVRKEAHNAGAAAGEAEWHADGYKVGFYEGGAEMVEQTLELFEGAACTCSKIWPEDTPKGWHHGDCPISFRRPIRSLSPDPNWLQGKIAEAIENDDETVERCLPPPITSLKGVVEGLRKRTKETKELREALVVYGRHKENCDFLNILPSKPCKCGFDEVRQALKKTEQAAK